MGNEARLKQSRPCRRGASSPVDFGGKFPAATTHFLADLEDDDEGSSRCEASTLRVEDCVRRMWVRGDPGGGAGRGEPKASFT